jgi:hypothetical protein
MKELYNRILKIFKDRSVCPQGEIIPFKKVFYEKKNHTKKKEYRASSKLCKGCPIRQSCLGKSAQEKKFTVTYYREEYERAIARVESKQGNLILSDIYLEQSSEIGSFF